MVLVVLAAFSISSAALAVVDSDLAGPPGSESFGMSVLVLANGNYAATDPDFDAEGVENVGAVYLFDGATDTIISTLTGSGADDRVGSDGLLAVGSSNFVVSSSEWNERRGAVTFVNGETGLSAIVSSTNSLVGSAPGDVVGQTFFSGFGSGVPSAKRLSNGHYVVESVRWSGGPDLAGAVTWGDGEAGVTGEITPGNSLVGGAEGDIIQLIRSLDNGNYLVGSDSWDAGSVEDVGAVAWASGNGGSVGLISGANSLIGSQADDRVGRNRGVIDLGNGHYVVRSPQWSGGGPSRAGAVTWGNGENGATVGTVSDANSLVGASANEQLGGDVVGLTDGDYLVVTRNWNASPSLLGVGAVAYAPGNGGLAGTIGVGNSLVGVSGNDGAGISAFALDNGHYVVSMPGWDDAANGYTDAGAVIWGDGDAGITGPVTAAGSLVGNRDEARVGSNLGGEAITPLRNGNYVINSPRWKNTQDEIVGAATWMDGSGPASGTVSTANSLHGQAPEDGIGRATVALTNGNYVVVGGEESRFDLDHVTWGSGTGGLAGPVDETRSLVLGSGGGEIGTVVALANGHYVVLSPFWEDASTDADVGAITWGNGEDGSTVGTLGIGNSLIGAQALDRISAGDRVLLANGSLLQTSVFFSNGAETEAGAITWIAGDQPTTGVVGIDNSVIGSSANDQLGQYSLCFNTGIVGCGSYGELPDGDWLVASSRFDDGSEVDAGAVVRVSGTGPTTGTVTEDNAAIGSSATFIGRLPRQILLTKSQKFPLATGSNSILILNLSEDADTLFRDSFESP